MTIQVLSPGMFTTVQDLGRPGYGLVGVSRSGAADAIALRLGNRLVGNPENAAALEMTLLGGTYLFSDIATVAITGAECGLPMWQSFVVNAGETLKIGGMQVGARCYLCISGGIDVPLFAGSASTHVLSGLGGFEGRALRKGDLLKVGQGGTFLNRSVRPEVLSRFAPRKTLRVTAGPQAELFTVDALDSFYAKAYRVTDDANRMGLRLAGARIEAPYGGQMITEGVSLGAIQISTSGDPIILFVDQQTTGGYPKIANVITVDLPSVGQLRPRDEVRFELVDSALAQVLVREQEAFLMSGEILL